MNTRLQSTEKLRIGSLFESPKNMLQGRILTVALLAVLALPAALPAQDSPQSVAAVDVELGPRGEWKGSIVDVQGIAVDRLTVQLSNAHGPAAQLATDGHGRFAFSGLSAGVHVLQGSGKPRLYRFWKYGTAPPKATRDSLIVAQGTVVRGVQGSKIYDWMSDNRVLTYSGIAAAIVVPIVILGRRDDSSPASP